MSSYREERRLDKAADVRLQLEAEERRREQDRADRREKEEQRRRDDRERRKDAERRRDRARARRAALRARALEEADTVAALVVMACAMIPAAVVQVWGMSKAGSPVALAVSLAIMLESGAWVATLTGERAKRDGRPTLPHRLAMWGNAIAAGSINAWKVPAIFPDAAWMSPVMFFASLAGVFFWELRGLGKHEPKDKPSAAERRAARAKIKAERKQDRARRRQMPKVWKKYEEILAAEVHGQLSRDEAWEEAQRAVAFDDVWPRYEQLLRAVPGKRNRTEVWEQAWWSVHRLPVGETAATLAGSVVAWRLAEDVAEDAASHAVDAFVAGIFGTGDDGHGLVGGGHPDGPHGGPHGTGGTEKDLPSAGASQGRTALVRKGIDEDQAPSVKTPKKPLDDEDVKAVRKLARSLGGPEYLSVAKIRNAGIGGTNAYVVRLRNHVQGKAAKK